MTKRIKNVETKRKNLILERKITSTLNEFIKQDAKDTLNFTKTIILRAPFFLLFYRRPKASKTHTTNWFEILHKISDKIPKFLSKEKKMENLLASESVFCVRIGGNSGEKWCDQIALARSLRNKVVQTLRSYHDFATSAIARDKEAIHWGGKNEASKSTGLIDKSVTRIDLIA